MKHRWMLGLALLAACGGSASPSAVAPAETPRESVNAFMQAVADSNLTRMAMLWGTARGPAAVTRQPSDYERRILVMHSFLRGSRHRITNDYPTDREGRRTVEVNLTRDGCSYTLPITTVRSSSGWLVNSFDLSVVGAPGRACGAPIPDSLPSADADG